MHRIALTMVLVNQCANYVRLLALMPSEIRVKVVVDSLLIVTPIVGFYNCAMFCCVLFSVHSSFAINSMGEERADCFAFFVFRCLLIVVWLFLTIPLVCLQFVIVVFPDHTHYFQEP